MISEDKEISNSSPVGQEKIGDEQSDGISWNDSTNSLGQIGQNGMLIVFVGLPKSR